MEKIKTEILSILEEYKRRIQPKNKTIAKPAKIIISTSDILRKPSDIKSDLSREMSEAMNKHIELYGNQDEPEIKEFIETCLVSFSEFWNEAL